MFIPILQLYVFLMLVVTTAGQRLLVEVDACVWALEWMHCTAGLVFKVPVPLLVNNGLLPVTSTSWSVSLPLPVLTLKIKCNVS
jgi:hypothetical protein